VKSERSRVDIDRLHALHLDPTTLRIEPLGSQHNRLDFTCGEAALDRYLTTKAGQDVKRNLARCFVLIPDPGAAQVLGYCTLSSHTIDPGELDPASARKLRAYPALPAVLLGRLAVDSRFQGARLGWLLLMHALRTALEILYQIGTRSVVVDALHERAAGFYAELGFTPIGRNPLRLHLPMASIALLFPAYTERLPATYAAASSLFDIDTGEYPRS
jgi:GNAT superfamily N-acetyltransferase